nr:hypothetical protein [Tanacetum cinerariifolium]
MFSLLLERFMVGWLMASYVVGHRLEEEGRNACMDGGGDGDGVGGCGDKGVLVALCSCVSTKLDRMVEVIVLPYWSYWDMRFLREFGRRGLRGREKSFVKKTLERKIENEKDDDVIRSEEDEGFL